MRIVIDLTVLSYHITGIERYALCITEELLLQDNSNNYVLLFRDMVFPEFEQLIKKDNIEAKILYGNNKLFFREIILAKTLKKIQADRYLFLAFSSPVWFTKRGIINTIHDMGAWDASYAMTLKQKIYFRLTTRIAAQRAVFIITVSEFSKKRICSILHTDENKIIVIPSAISQSLKNNKETLFLDIKKKYNLPDKYIMSLSTIEPRKNMKLLLEAFTELENPDFDLVMVGRLGWKMDEVLEHYKAYPRIHFTDFIPDADVTEVYKNAMCFVFPSSYEGFGLPPLEALTLGVPVISSDAASLPEVLRNQAVYFHNNEKDELVKLLKNLEDNYASMPNQLDDYQKDNFDFSVSAFKVLQLLNKPI